MGCIYKRGNIWWIKYYRNGKPHLESSKSESEAKAERLLKRREGEIAKGELPGIYFDKVRFDDLAKDFLTDYEINKRKTIDKARIYVKDLEEFFGGNRIVDITTDRIKGLIQEKINEGSLLSKIEISPQSRRGRREVIFLFGGERPPNKKPSFCQNMHFLRPCNHETQPVSVPEG